MKAVLMNLIMVVLLLPCAYGQSVSIPSRTENEQPAGVVVAEQTPITTTGDTHTGDTQGAESSSMNFSWIRAAGGMGLVLCLIVGIFIGAKKFAPRFFAKGVSEKSLKLIETLSMGDRRSISVIEVANHRFLVGNTANQITLLAALPEPLSVISEPEDEPPKPKETPKYDPRSPFRSLFEAEKKRPSQGAANPLPDDIRTKMRQLRDALER